MCKGARGIFTKSRDREMVVMQGDERFGDMPASSFVLVRGMLAEKKANGATHE